MSMSQSAARPTRSMQREKRTPKYVARAKVGNGWMTIGAAWQFRSGEDGLSVQLNTIPVGAWDGRFTLIPPLDNGQEPDPPQDE
jgi:hypothetical protein